MPGKVYLPAIGIDRTGIYKSGEYYRKMTMTRERTTQFYEIEMFIRDGGSTIVDNTSYPIKANNILICRPGMQRFSILPIECYFIWLELPAEGWLTAELASMPTLTAVAAPARYITLFESIRHHFGRIGGEVPLMARVSELIFNLYQETHRESQEQATDGRSRSFDRIVAKTAEYIEQAWNRPFSLSELAAHAHISPNHLHRIFSRALGQTPYQYILDRRMAAAKELLLNSDFNLAEIAERCAFSSQTYFSFVFRRETGQTPGEYRRGPA